MSAGLQWAIIIVGIILIAGLVWFIRGQWQHLSAARRVQAKTRALQEKRRESMVESIHLLAMAAEQEQVEYSEACIRIKGLLDHVAPELLAEEPYSIFQLMYEKTEHMPTHEARKQADRALIRKLDEERFALEEEHGEAIAVAVKAIRRYDFGEMSGQPQQYNPAVKSTLS